MLFFVKIQDILSFFKEKDKNKEKDKENKQQQYSSSCFLFSKQYHYPYLFEQNNFQKDQQVDICKISNEQSEKQKENLLINTKSQLQLQSLKKFPKKQLSKWQFQQLKYYTSKQYQWMQSSPQIQGKLNYYPIIGRKKSFPITSYHQQQMQKQQNQLDTVLLAKQYIKLGLKQPSQKLIRRQIVYYEAKYRLQQRYLKQLKQYQFPFCIVIPSFNNQDNMRYKLPLNSILRQDYKNYHIVYIDDASTDQTFYEVQKYIKLRELNNDKIRLIKNQQNQNALKNIYTASHQYCNQYDIMLILDGDDGLIGTQTLKLINLFYQTTDNWFIYSNFIYTVNSQNLGVSQKIDKNILKDSTYRDYALKDWRTSHLTTFYNKLFRKAKKQNFFQFDPQNNQEKFFSVNYDRAIIYPLIEMAGTRVMYLPQILYLYLEETNFSEGKIASPQQLRVLKKINKMPKQQKLECLFPTIEQSSLKKQQQERQTKTCQISACFLKRIMFDKTQNKQ